MLLHRFVNLPSVASAVASQEITYNCETYDPIQHQACEALLFGVRVSSAGAIFNIDTDESVNPKSTPRYSPFNTKTLNNRVNTGADSSRQWSRTSGQGSKIRLPNSLSTGVPGLSSGTLSGEGFTNELKDGGFFSGGYGQDRGNINIAKLGGTVHAYSNGNGADGASHHGGEGTRKASIDESNVDNQNTGSRITTGRDGTPGSNNTVAITQGSSTTGSSSIVQGAQAEA